MLKDRVALITGASRGIGAATARLLAANGAAVAVNYVTRREAGEAVVRHIRDNGGRALLVQADVTVQSEVEQMVRAVEQEFGFIDTVVLNANIHFPIVPFIAYRWEDFESKLDGELKAAFYCCQAVVPAMIAHRRGCIIAVSSGLSRHPGTGFVAHSTAKSALDAFVKSLAHELGPDGIRVNTVAPGLTITDATAGVPEQHKSAIAGMTPLRRIATPDDVAGAVLMLASEKTGFVTGTYVPVDGGMQML
ncbi:MAG: SDR family NAD(P)-dependent oxidoreductase [Terriglobales bacterium]